MRLDPKAVAARMGLNGERLVGTIVDCPLCHSSGKLELRSLQLVQCRACGFIGDLIRLYAAVKKETVASAVSSLTSKGLLDLEGSEKTYIDNAVMQQSLIKLVEVGAEILRGGAPGSYLAVLSQFDCRMFTQIPEHLRRHVIPLSKQQIDDLPFSLPSDADETLRWWGKHGAVALPAYDGPDLVGFWLLTTKGEKYLPVIIRKTGAVFSRIPSMSDDYTFVVDDIAEALRLTIWSSINQTYPLGFIVPVGVRDAVEHYASKRVVYWSMTDDTPWIMRSRHCTHNMVLMNGSIGRGSGPFPCNGDYTHFMDRVKNSVINSFTGIARHLLSIPRRKAVEALSSEPLEPAERSLIVANASGEDARMLQQMMQSQSQITVDWCGVPVVETPNGWVSKGRLISAAMFYMDELRPFPDSADGMITGSVIHAGRSVTFQEKLSVLRRNTAAWLEGFVVQKFGAIAYIERSWRQRLLEISQRFRRPNSVMPEERYGWQEHSLRMPFFLVDNKGLTPSYNIVDGPKLPHPAPFTDAEKDAFLSETFCRLFLIVFKNIMQTRTAPVSGWLMVNQPSVIERTAYALGYDVQYNPSDAAAQLQKTEPIIRPTILTDALSRVMNQSPPPNALVSVDSLTASLAHVFYGWPIVEAEHQVEYQGLRGVFFAVHQALAQPRTLKTYRDYAAVAMEYFGTRGALVHAGLTLDKAVNAAEQTMPSKLLKMIVSAHTLERLPASEADGGMRVAHSDFLSLVAGSAVRVPDIKDLTHQLAGASYLVGTHEDAWVFAANPWSFYTSYATVYR